MAGAVISQAASGVTLAGLNLGGVTIGTGAIGEQVLNSLVNGDIVIAGNPFPVGNAFNNGNNVISGNTVNGLIHTSGGFSANDQVVNNTINTSSEAVAPSIVESAVFVGLDSGATVRNNAVNIAGQGFNTGNILGIRAEDSTGALIDGNTVNIGLDTSALTLAPTGFVGGIFVDNTGTVGGTVTALVQRNTVTTNNIGQGNGLSIAAFSGTNADTAVTVQGNDFHGNTVGVQYFTAAGDATPMATTLGGTAQTGGAFSLGGNDFRGTGLAIEIATSSGGPLTAGQVLAAQLNIFAGTPNTLASGGTIDTSSQLSSARAFVQVLYEKLTGNVVGLSQLDAFTGFLSFGAAGQQFVAAQLQFSALGLGHLVDSVAQQLVGHPLSAAVRSSLVFQLQSGASLESVESQIIAGQDYYSATGGNVLNTAFQQLTGLTADPATSQFLQQLQFVPGASGLPNGVQGVALQVTQTPQSRTLAVDQLFLEFYHRAPTSSELAFVVFGGSLLDLELGLLSTAEFFNNA